MTSKKISTRKKGGQKQKRAKQERVEAALKLVSPHTIQRYPEECITTPRKTTFRSVFALRRTIELYLERGRRNAEAAGLDFYIRLWTITAVEAISYGEFMSRWNTFLSALKRLDRNFSGVRVLEAHPGEDYEVPGQPGRWETISHGLHMHFITDRFYRQKDIQKIAKRVGLGFVSVSGRCATGEEHTILSVTNYLAKYLRKGLCENLQGLKRRRMWAPINFPDAVSVREVQIMSRWRVVLDRLSCDYFFKGLDFSIRVEVANFGEIASRLIDKGMYDQLYMLKSTWESSCSAYSIGSFVEILKPSCLGSRFHNDDCSRYAYLPTSLSQGWPGVSKYLDWLYTSEGLEWSCQRNNERIERDRERQRKRRRELAFSKKAKNDDVRLNEDE